MAHPPDERPDHAWPTIRAVLLIVAGHLKDHEGLHLLVQAAVLVGDLVVLRQSRRHIT